MSFIIIYFFGEGKRGKNKENLSNYYIVKKY